MAERRGLVADSLIALILGGALLVASLLALGPPDVGLAGQFLSGSYPSMPTAVACLSLLCYAAVVSVAAVAVIGGARTAGRGGAPAEPSEELHSSSPAPSSSA